MVLNFKSLDYHLLDSGIGKRWSIRRSSVGGSRPSAGALQQQTASSPGTLALQTKQPFVVGPTTQMAWSAASAPVRASSDATKVRQATWAWMSDLDKKQFTPYAPDVSAAIEAAYKEYKRRGWPAQAEVRSQGANLIVWFNLQGSMWQARRETPDRCARISLMRCYCCSRACCSKRAVARDE